MKLPRILTPPLLLQFYFLQTITTTMSQPSNQNSPSNSSPNQTSSQKITIPNPQPSDIITNAVPLTMVHPSFASALNLPKNSTTKPSPSPKPKSKKKSKTNTTKKPKPQKPNPDTLLTSTCKNSILIIKGLRVPMSHLMLQQLLQMLQSRLLREFLLNP